MSNGLRDGEFLTFRDYFYRKTGIYYEERRRANMESRLFRRMADAGFTSFRPYFVHMRFQASGQELQELINAMTVNETFFFREESQLKCLVGPVLDEVTQLKRPRERLRLWSVPTASGEESYSIALYLLEYWRDIHRVDVEIIGSDIDTEILGKAREGVYSERSVHRLPPEILEHYFSRQGEDYRISQELRSSITFTQVNLVDASQTRKYRGFDVIFCRNLLIYFDEASRREAAETLFDALNPGGFLFLGHAESMSRISSIFTVRRFADVFAYQRPRS